jgi:nucleoid DNA-binding protein
MNLKAVARKVLREYHMWIAEMICEGKTISMYDLGTLRATFRSARVNVGTFRKPQPASYVLKIKPSKKVKDALVRLAADKTRLYFGVASRSPKIFRPFHERSRNSGADTANEGFQTKPEVESSSVGDHIHVQVGREDRETLRVAEGVTEQAGAHGEPTGGCGDRPVSTPVAPTDTIL